MTSGRVAWSGLVLGVQPRIDLMRSFDQRSHSYLGYVLSIEGAVEGASGEFTVRIGPGMLAKHTFRAGDRVSGIAHRVLDRDRETADLYRASALVFETRGVEPVAAPGPPWRGVPPPLPVYRERGHRRLDARTYDAKCRTCQWGCRMPVAMIVDQWQPTRREYRFETFCYGPKSCAYYRPGPTRKVPGRRGMSWEEENWVDEETVEHRGPDE
ncbi:MAG: hypothetical protein ABI920_17990 [Casimicrobiaceae bacterium]